VIANGGRAIAIAIDVVFVSLGLLASVNTTLKEKFPFTVGVPEITPVVAAMDSPEGRLPDITFQV
jgi:hypothetical protein